MIENPYRDLAEGAPEAPEQGKVSIVDALEHVPLDWWSDTGSGFYIDVENCRITLVGRFFSTYLHVSDEEVCLTREEKKKIKKLYQKIINWDRTRQFRRVNQRAEEAKQKILQRWGQK
jgi:hypothetical protein